MTRPHAAAYSESSVAFRLLARRLVVITATLAFLGGFVLPIFSSHDVGADDDAACNDPVIAAGYTSAHPQISSPTAAPEHCAYCHWLRAVTGASAAPIAQLSQPGSRPVRITPASCSLRVAPIAARPSRGPPSTSLS